MKEGVIAIVRTNQQARVLLVKRRDVPLWVLPGGGIDEGETPEQAVVREVLEETGLLVKISRKVAEYTPINRLTTRTHVYECEPVGGAKQLTDETREIGDFEVGALPSSLLIVHRDWLDDARQNLPSIIKKPISRVTYCGLALYFCRHPILVLRALAARLGLPINTK